MSFLVDLVSEDSFYINLLLGLYKVLSRHPQITDIKLSKEAACEKTFVSSWEQKHLVLLPDDMKQFYLAIDGFNLTWSFKYSEEKILPIGLLRIRPLLQLTPVDLNSDMPKHLQQPLLDVNSSRVFEMDELKKNSKVVLVFLTPDTEPSIWIVDKCSKWSHLANSFTQYFRMMLVHHGLPQWQHCFLAQGLSMWAEEIYMMVAPHLLQPGKRKSKSTTEPSVPDMPHNHIDPVIFSTSSQILQRRYKNSK